MRRVSNRTFYLDHPVYDKINVVKSAAWWECELDYEVHENPRNNSLRVGWHNLQTFVFQRGIDM